MTRHSGSRKRMRRLLRKDLGSRSGPRPEVYLSELEPGAKVVILVDPASHKGMPHRRYHGRVGRIVEKRGRGYVVAVQIGSKLRKLSVLPEHLRPAESPVI
jgi:large subunit ribosomal protein L21e